MRLGGVVNADRSLRSVSSELFKGERYIRRLDAFVHRTAFTRPPDRSEIFYSALRFIPMPNLMPSIILLFSLSS